MPQAFSTCAITSGLSGSPAPISSRSRTSYAARSCWIRRRHTVGGAHSEVTPFATIASSREGASNRGWFTMNTVAAAFHGANTHDQACFAQPGDEMFRWTSPGCRPSQYIVERCPAG